MNEKPLNHQVLIVRIPAPRVHTNAGALELFDILGYQLVAKKGNYKAGDLAVYIQPDSVVPETPAFAWLWQDRGIEGPIPAKYRRITVRKFRKEYSEGLLMPLADFTAFSVTTGAYDIYEGSDVSSMLGITHWEGEDAEFPYNVSSAQAPKQKRRPKTVMGWLRHFYYNTVRVLSGGRAYRRESSMEVPFESPEYDVVSMKAARSGFADDEYVTVTEKLHGSNGRFLFLDGVFYIGSHFQWKSPETPCIFTRVAQQHPWIEEWCRANEGRILYGEVIGDQKGFTYGFDKSKGELGFYVFDIREPNGTWTKPFTGTANNMGYGVSYDQQLQVVPILYIGLFDSEKIKSLTDGVSTLDRKTIREGVVISESIPAPAGSRRPRQVKRVSNVFLEKDAK